MRRRSRKDSTSLKLLKFKDIGKENCVNNKKCITRDLSKINMFTKAVRSETITRPVISTKTHPDLSQSDGEKSYDSQNEAEIKFLSSSTSCHDSSEHVIKGSGYLNPNSIDDHSSDSFVTCTNSNKKHNPVNEEATHLRVSSFTTASRSEENFVDCLYDDLMDAIPLYIKTNFSNHINEDVIIEKSKKALQNIYAVNCEQEMENDISIIKNNDITIKVTETFVQNPMDFLRLGCIQQESHSDHTETSDEDTTHTTDYSYSPFAESQNLHTLLSHTPEYNYFPHKLN
ncbi:unnamed protein product [Chilo suppressalis]|uniref:BESS domain-containing protein n=1 Tax=Chilo suppressalis TaxID=168631 RepID=A0ABN8ASY0_CHISP|nr:unnamed protein product [Chilo suppressalis]